MFPSRRKATMGGDKFRDAHSIAVDGSNFALLHSKSQYNIVDAL